MSDPVVSTILDRVQDHRNQSSQHLRDMVEFARIFQNIPKRRTREDGKSQYANTFVMETFRDVESVASAWSAIIFGDDPWFEAAPSAASPDAYNRARITEQVMRKQHMESGFKSKIDEEMRYLALFGTMVMGTEWNYTTRWIVQNNDYVKIPFLDMPDIRGLWLPSVSFDPNAEDVNDAAWIAEETFVHPGAVRPIVDNARKLRTFNMGTITDPKPADLADGAAGSGGAGDQGETTTDQIRMLLGYNTNVKGRTSVINYWGKHPLAKPDDPDIDWRIVIVNRGEKVVEIPNPYHHGLKPYLKAQCFPRRQSFYGMGLGHILIRPQEEINDFRNLMRDLIMFSLYHPWKKSGGPALRNSRFRMQPWKIIDTAEYGNLEPMRPAIEALAYAIQLENMTKEDMRYASGGTGFTQGLQTGGTATETKFVASESSRRHLGTASRFTDAVLRPLLQRQHEMNMQFMERPYLVKVGGQEIMATRDMLLADPWFDFKTASDLDWRPVIQRRLTAAVQILGNITKDNPDVRVKIYPFVARLARSFGLDPNEVIDQMEAAQQPPPLQPLGAAPGAGEGLTGMTPEALASIAQREAMRQQGRTGVPGMGAPGLAGQAAENIIPPQALVQPFGPPQ
jgi:hypothetical protein